MLRPTCSSEEQIVAANGRGLTLVLPDRRVRSLPSLQGLALYGSRHGEFTLPRRVHVTATWEMFWVRSWTGRGGNREEGAPAAHAQVAGDGGVDVEGDGRRGGKREKK